MPPKKESSVAVLDPPEADAPLRIPTPRVGATVLFWWHGNYGNPPMPAIVLKAEATGQVQIHAPGPGSNHAAIVWRGLVGEKYDNMRRAHGAWDYLEGDAVPDRDYARHDAEAAKRGK